MTRWLCSVAAIAVLLLMLWDQRKRMSAGKWAIWIGMSAIMLGNIWIQPL